MNIYLVHKYIWNQYHKLVALYLDCKRNHAVTIKKCWISNVSYENKEPLWQNFNPEAEILIPPERNSCLVNQLHHNYVERDITTDNGKSIDSTRLSRTDFDNITKHYGRKHIYVIETAEECDAFVNELRRTNVHQIAMDCEGVRLGRFGKLCLLQVCTGNKIVLFDALKDQVIEKLRSVLESAEILKIIHDCREDNSALTHQFGICMRNVYDTQVAHMLNICRNSCLHYHPSLQELLCTYLLKINSKVSVKNLQMDDCYYEQLLESSKLEATTYKTTEVPTLNSLDEEYFRVMKLVKQQMHEDSYLWLRRPLRLKYKSASDKGNGVTDLLKYATYGVSCLLKVKHILDEKVSENEVIQHTLQNLSYAKLNVKFKSPASIGMRGRIIEAMLATRTTHALFFRLNCGRVGLASTPSSIYRFRDVKINDIVLAQVSNVSMDGSYIYLDRYHPVYEYWNLKRRSWKTVVEPQYVTYNPIWLPDWHIDDFDVFDEGSFSL